MAGFDETKQTENRRHTALLESAAFGLISALFCCQFVQLVSMMLLGPDAGEVQHPFLKPLKADVATDNADPSEAATYTFQWFEMSGGYALAFQAQMKGTLSRMGASQPVGPSAGSVRTATGVQASRIRDNVFLLESLMIGTGGPPMLSYSTCHTSHGPMGHVYCLKTTICALRSCP